MNEDRRQEDIMFGKLIAQVQTLTEEVEALRAKTDTLIGQMNTGKGLFYGALFAAGGVGAGLSQLLDKVLK